MAAKNERERNSRGDAGTTSAATDTDDDRDIQRLIDGDDGRETDGESSDVGNADDGDDRETERGGSKSKRSREADRSRKRESESDGIGSGTRRGKRTGTNTSTSGIRGNRTASAASEETREAPDVVSRTVKPPKTPKIEEEISIPGSNKEIIGDLFQFVFWGIGQATGLPEWELPEDDAETIGDNGEKWLKSLGPKRAKAVVNNLKKLGPSVAFFGSLGMALVPRVRLTISRAKNGAIRPPQERKGKGSGNSPDSTASGDSPTTTNSGNNGAAEINARPLTAGDLSEISTGRAYEDAGEYVN